ncbi:MAG: hypothetical protein GY710_12875 [Desulfobacteraceae bacterium]|nr:hypothetical protein [Desulfobacteraceae bacterium]
MVTKSQKISENHGSPAIKNFSTDGQIVDVNDAVITAVIFTLDDNYYAFNGGDVSGIWPFTKINFVPGCPGFILGIVNIRGDLESVISLHVLLDMEKPDISNKTRIVIAEKDQGRSGILVDSVQDVIDIPESSFNTSLYTHEKKFIVGEAFYRDKYVAIIDLGKLFSQIKVQTWTQP